MAENLFDRYRKAANNVIRGVMAYDAVWIPQDGSNPSGFSVKVLFKNPTENKELAGVDYDPDRYQMEYTEDQLPGLLASVAANNGGEEITINSILYTVQHVSKKFDGDSLIADINPK